MKQKMVVSKLFRAYRLYNDKVLRYMDGIKDVSKLFRAYRLYNVKYIKRVEGVIRSFKALSSLQVI